MSATAAVRPPVPVVAWVGDAHAGLLRLLDQTRLPTDLAFLECRDLACAWDAIRRLVVRGAPAIGVAAGYAMVLAAQECRRDAGGDVDRFHACLREKADYLKSCRPTAVNLAWAVDRVMTRAAVRAHAALAPPAVAAAMLEEAITIHQEDEAMCRAIGEHARPLVERCRGVLTHCNAGALATAGIGTATAGIYLAHAAGHAVTVYCDETRPLLQGSRLTAWELGQAGIDACVITDNMAAQVMREGRVQMVITGADRIAANGDAANKIGTYGVALLAKAHGIPFYVAAPTSTFDLSLAGGEAIPIEQRGQEEVTEGFGRRTAPAGVRVYAPAFDVTPAGLIAAIVTDRGLIQPVDEAHVRAVVESAGTGRPGA